MGKDDVLIPWDDPEQIPIPKGVRGDVSSSEDEPAVSKPASGDDSEGREPSGKILPGRLGVRPQLAAESLVYYS